MNLPIAAQCAQLYRAPRTLVALLLLILGAVMPFRPANAAPTPEIWFAPHAGHPTRPGALDYQTLFRADNPAWVAITDKFQVYLVSLTHLRNAPDDELVRTPTDLHSRHIALAIGTNGVGRRDGETCSSGEGYGTPAITQAFVARLLRLHIRPDIVDMDSPMWYGHFDPQHCRHSMPVMIQRISGMLAIWNTAFPGLTYGDTEPWLQIQVNPTWRHDYAMLLDGITAQTGIRLKFAHTDTNIHLHPNWAAELMVVQAFVHELGLKYGMIYDGLNTETSDVEWIANAKDRIATLEGQIHSIPDTALIMSYDDYPSRILPSTDQTTLSSLLIYYLSLPH